MRNMLTGQVTSVDEALHLIGRTRDREWFAYLLKLLGKGVPMDDALEAATRVGYANLDVAAKDKVMAKAHAKLAQPDVCQAMEQIFALRGFTIESAIDMQVRHIRGDLTREVMTEQGPVEVRIPPSYVALKDFFSMVVPKQTNKVQIATLNLNDMMQSSVEDMEPIEARLVGPVIDTDPVADYEDIDPFEDDDDDLEDEDEDEDGA